MTSDAIVEGLCGAISTIVSSALQDLSYDQTIICTIVDNSKSSIGEYKVTDGSTEFVAKSENTSYQKDDQVRVSILKGDMTQEKFIIGKYVNSDSNVPITYMSPLDSVMKMTDNLFTGKKDDDKPYGLYANGQKTLLDTNEWEPQKEQEILSTITLGDNQSSMINTQIYDTAYIQLDLKTLMSEYNIVSGHYGIGVSLGLVKDQKYVSSADYIFDSSQMLGNPYNFGIYTQQAAKFDIRSVGTINTIVVFWYQDGNFKHITHSDEAQNVESYTPNILAKNITIGFGSNVINVADDTIKLFSLDEEKYNGNDSELLRELKVAWYNKNDLGQSINFNDAAVSKAITDDNIIKTIQMGDSLIKFVDEYQYRKLSETNNRRNAQIDYDIPMDVQGLELAAAIKKTNEKLKSLSLMLSKDLHQTIEKFKARCNISVFTEYYTTNKISEIINNQYISIGSTNTLPETIDTFFKNHMDALNRAAKKYNKVPSTVSSEGWTFKAKTTDKPENSDSWNETTLFETYFETTLKNYLNNFLSSLKTSISSSYSGYMGIYDNYETKINSILNSIESQWQEIKLILNSFNYPISEKQNSTSQSLTNAVLSYWNDNYTFVQWIAQDLTKYENAYSVYWYRSNKLTTDSIAGKGWELIGKGYNENNVESSIDYTNYEQIKILLDPTKEKEEFKVLLFFNHRQHESNTIIFENTTDFNKQIADASNYITITHGTNSHESYQSYGQINTLLNGADKYRQRILNITYINHETGLMENDKLINAQIYWYIPKNSTMLTYDIQDLDKLNLSNKFINDIASSADNPSERQKTGYTMFYKTIKTAKKKVEGVEIDVADERDLQFSYRIKDYYVPSATENHILCDVVIGDMIYPAEVLMNFSSYGTSGSDYTLMVSPVSNQSAITVSNTENNPFVVKIDLFNNKNTPVDLKNATINVRLLNKTHSGLNIKELQDTDDKCQRSIYVDTTSENAILADILEVKVSEVAPYELTVYYPIAYAAGTQAFIEGASTVIYDNNGGSPSYYKDPYKYFDDDGKGNVRENTDVTLTRHFSPSISNEENKIIPYMPIIDKNKKLVPSAMWVSNCNVYNTTDNKKIVYYTYIEGKNGNDVVWRQPLIIMQNRYPSPMINAWDGSLKIDEENGTIMSTMVGAGRKNKENAFEGVLMGDVATGTQTDKGVIGLYGFNNGEQSFGFKVDGTAFIGKSGHGRIEFNGNNGTIKSASYDNKLYGGMLIDIDDGVIDIKGGCYDYDENGDIKKDENGNLLYNENQKPSRIIINSKSPYFEIISKNNQSLMKVSDKDYYLKSDNFNVTNEEGTKFDLWNGSLIGYNFTLKALSNNNGVILSSKGTDEEPYFAIKHGGKNLLYADDNEFYLKSEDENLNFNIAEGSLTATNFILSAGNIILSSGGKNPYLHIKASNEKSILYVDEKDYYLQSSNFSNEETKGVQLNLNNGSLIGYNFTLSAGTITTGGIWLSNTGNPYLKIMTDSELKDDDGNKIITTTFESSKNNFYLQSANFNSTLKAGIKLDLKEGSLEGYDFTLKALSSNGAGIILQNNKDLYFQVKAKSKDSNGNNQNLLTISEDEFVLQSSDPKVMSIDIANGSISSTNFNLTASSGPNESSSVISVNSGEYNKDEGKIEGYLSFLIQAQGKPLIHIKDDAIDAERKFFLASYDWDLKGHKGTFFNLKEGSLQSYNFNLIAYGEQNQYVIIDSSAENSPFNINDKFKINWDGSFSINEKSFKVDAEGNFWINADNLNDAPFYVNKEGTFKATKGTIGGWNIDVDKLTSNITNEVQTLADGTTATTQTMTLGCNGTINIGIISQTPEEIFASGGQSFGFEVDNTGRMRSQCAYLNACTVTGAMLIPGKVLIRNVSTANDVNLQYIFKQKFYFDVREDSYFYKDIILPTSNQLTAWYEPHNNNKPNQYNRSWIKLGDGSADEGGGTGGFSRGNTIRIGSKHLDLYSEKITIGHNVILDVNEEDYQNSMTNAKASTIEFYGKKTTFNHGGVNDDGVFFKGNVTCENNLTCKDNLILKKGVSAQSIQDWKIASNAFTTYKHIDTNLDSMVRDCTLKVYIIMTVMKLLENIKLLPYTKQYNSNKPYESAIHFASYATDSILNSYEVYHPWTV